MTILQIYCRVTTKYIVYVQKSPWGQFRPRPSTSDQKGRSSEKSALAVYAGRTERAKNVKKVPNDMVPSIGKKVPNHP